MINGDYMGWIPFHGQNRRDLEFANLMADLALLNIQLGQHFRIQAQKPAQYDPKQVEELLRTRRQLIAVINQLCRDIATQ